MSQVMYIIILSLLFPWIGASKFNNDRVTLEEDHDINDWRSRGWEMVKRVAAHDEIYLSFAIKQRNVGQLEEIFWAVSNPKSKNYAHYLDAESVARLVTPSKKSIYTIKSWLRQNRITKCVPTQNNDFINCETTASVAESLLLGAKFYKFQHLKTSQFTIRSLQHYTVPNKINKHLDFVGGLLRFPALNYARVENKAEIPVTETGFLLHIGVYPSVLRDRYNISSSTVGKHPNNSQAVAQFLGQHYGKTDLEEFFVLFGRSFTHLSDVSKVIGPDAGRSGVEASLDVQYIMSMGANITTWFWSTPGKHESQEPFLQWIIAVGNTSQVPFVISVSYGDNEDSLSVDYMDRINVEFMKAGVRGITILFASGDNGAGCKKNKFRPNFPCSSPYVTAVGGTAFNNPFAVDGEYGYEISGGGFSNVFKRPQYQDDLVNYYLKNSKKLPNETYYNKTGRAYPDISAICNHFWIVNNFIPVPGVMGTSASTPTVAGIVSLLNDVRFQNNKPPLGFLNPFLYSHRNTLFDPTTGYNEGCGEPDRGFYAMEGWDPVTGCGTPNYPTLVKAVLEI